MHWYEQLGSVLERGKIYSHKELIDDLKALRPELSGSTYHWAVSSLVRSGQLTRCGYDAYAVQDGLPKKSYRPVYSDLSEELIAKISNQYPYMSFTVFETVLMNEFLNHLIAQNTVFLQVEKDSAIFVFHSLQECGYPNVLYRPTAGDFDLYWSRNVIVVTNLISEAPMRAGRPHDITLEKLLVDMVTDRIIAATYSPAELPDVFEEAQQQYGLDTVRLLRYARRRGREKVLRQYLEGITS